VWVPVIRFTACDLRVLMDQPTEHGTSWAPAAGPRRWSPCSYLQLAEVKDGRASTKPEEASATRAACHTVAGCLVQEARGGSDLWGVAGASIHRNDGLAAGDGLTLRERFLVHQVHPAKLATDIGASAVSTVLFWQHRLVLGLLVFAVPPRSRRRCYGGTWPPVATRRLDGMCWPTCRRRCRRSGRLARSLSRDPPCRFLSPGFQRV
jgi:hypothetical protein